jgi:hypothetical protein
MDSSDIDDTILQLECSVLNANATYLNDLVERLSRYDLRLDTLEMFFYSALNDSTLPN